MEAVEDTAIDYVLRRARDGLRALPSHMHDGMMRYIEYGIEPGGFAMAVLANDLGMAVGRADSTNGHFLKQWALFCYNDIPMDSKGSYEKVNAWIAAGGIRGLAAKFQSEGVWNGTTEGT